MICQSFFACGQDQSDNAKSQAQDWVQLQVLFHQAQMDDPEKLILHVRNGCRPEDSYFKKCAQWVAQQLAIGESSTGEALFPKGSGRPLAEWLMQHFPEMVVARQILAREMIVSQELDSARILLLALLELDHPHGFENFWLSQLETQAGNYDLAQEYASTFENFDGASPQLAANMIQSIQEHESEEHIQNKLERVHTAHFLIYTEGTTEQAQQVGEVLEREWSTLTQRFNLTLEDELEVVLFDNQALGGSAAQVSWVQASYNGKLRVPLSSIEFGESFDATMMHELTHAILDQSMGKDVPTWFHEGLAQLMEGRHLDDFPDSQVSIPTLGELARPFAETSDELAARARYRVALAMIQQIIEDSSLESLQNMLSIGTQNSSWQEGWETIYPGDDWQIDALYKRAVSSLSQ